MPRWLPPALLLVAAACTTLDGLSGGAAPEPGSDGGSDATTAPAEGGTDGGPTGCSAETPFQTPVPVKGLASGADETGISLTADQTIAYFSRIADGGFASIFFAARPTPNDTFAREAPAPGLPTSSYAGEPSLSPDGLALFFNVRPDPNASFSIAVASRATTTAPFGNIAPLAAIAGTSDTVDPYATTDALYFVSDRGTGASFDILRAERSGTGLGSVAVVSELASSAGEVGPVVSDDELVVYFGSDRGAVSGKYEIYVATRAARGAPFSTPQRVAELGSPELEVPRWLSPDLCTLYLASRRAGGQGQSDLYVARRSPR